MEQKINHIQNCIVAVLVVFYGVSLAVNAILAISGKADLAVWHWGPFALTAVFAWRSLPAARRCRIIIYGREIIRISKHVSRRVARSMFTVAIRAVRNLPALYNKEA